jgi:hypothetical protein
MAYAVTWSLFALGWFGLLALAIWWTLEWRSNRGGSDA